MTNPKQVYLLMQYYPSDEYDENSSGNYVDLVYEDRDEALAKMKRLNYELKKCKVNDSENNYYTVVEKDVVRKKRCGRKRLARQDSNITDTN